MSALTDRQRQVLRTLWNATCLGPAPTVRELAGKLGLRSTNGMQEHLLRLKAAGLVTWQAGRCRTLELTEAGRSYL